MCPIVGHALLLIFSQSFRPPRPQYGLTIALEFFTSRRVNLNRPCTESRERSNRPRSRLSFIISSFFFFFGSLIPSIFFHHFSSHRLAPVFMHNAPFHNPPIYVFLFLPFFPSSLEELRNKNSSRLLNNVLIPKSMKLIPNNINFIQLL